MPSDGPTVLTAPLKRQHAGKFACDSNDTPCPFPPMYTSNTPRPHRMVRFPPCSVSEKLLYLIVLHGKSSKIDQVINPPP